MNVILGATGHVGSAMTQALLDEGRPVTAVIHDEAKAAALRERGAEVAVVDVLDVAALRAILQAGQRAFLLNPPAAPSTDTDAEERATAKAIVAALDGSGLEKVVAQSTYGARPAEHAGDLGVLFEMEEAIRALPIPASFIRAAYYMSNWDAALETARGEGLIHTMFPAGLAMPMVAPRDLGKAAAQLILAPANQTGVHHVEGPRRYSSTDVADAFAAALGKPVEARTTPREQWVAAFRSQGFSEAAADSYARMTAIAADGDFPDASGAERGETDLQTYIADLVARAAHT